MCVHICACVHVVHVCACVYVCAYACVRMYVCGGGVGVCARLTECEYTRNVSVCVVNADTSNREKAAFRVEEAEIDAEWSLGNKDSQSQDPGG